MAAVLRRCWTVIGLVARTASSWHQFLAAFIISIAWSAAQNDGRTADFIADYKGAVAMQGASLLELQVPIRDTAPPGLQLARPSAEAVLRDSYHLHRRNDLRHVLFEVHLVHDALDRDVAPFVSRQGEQHRGQSALDEGELRRQRIDRDDLDLLWIDLRHQPWREARP